MLARQVDNHAADDLDDPIAAELLPDRVDHRDQYARLDFSTGQNSDRIQQIGHRNTSVSFQLVSCQFQGIVLDVRS